MWPSSRVPFGTTTWPLDFTSRVDLATTSSPTLLLRESTGLARTASMVVPCATWAPALPVELVACAAPCPDVCEFTCAPCLSTEPAVDWLADPLACAAGSCAVATPTHKTLVITAIRNAFILWLLLGTAGSANRQLPGCGFPPLVLQLPCQDGVARARRARRLESMM